MASTNKTTHYELSQYVGTDKPTYLTDYNGDMSAIDTGIYNAQTKADSAEAAAGVADGKAVQAQSDATSALNSAGTANTNIGTMANLTTTDKSSLVNAINEVKYNISLFNLTSYSTLTFTSSSGTQYGTTNIYLAKNGNGSLFKMYGEIDLSGVNQSTITLTSGDTGLRPESSYTIAGLGIKELSNDGISFTSPFTQDITVNTDGTITIPNVFVGSYSYVRLIFFPCLLFNNDFGDVPTPQN